MSISPITRGAVAARQVARAKAALSSAALAVLYDDFLGAVCRDRGLDVARVRAALASYTGRRVPNFMPELIAATRARRLALYLMNVELDVPQCQLAAIAGMSRSGVFLALRWAEWERDIHDYDRLVERVARDVLGARP